MAGPFKSYRCTTCGSEDVLTDAWSRWNPALGEEELSSSFDDQYCDACERECSTEEFVIDDPERIATLTAELEAHKIRRLALEHHALLSELVEDWRELMEDDEAPIGGADTVEWLCMFWRKAAELMETLK